MEFKINNKGLMTGYKRNGDETEIIIPEGVKVIKNTYDITGVKKIIFPSTLEKISYTFYLDSKSDLEIIVFKCSKFKTDRADGFNFDNIKKIVLPEDFNAPWSTIGFGGLGVQTTFYEKAIECVVICGQKQFVKSNQGSKIRTAVAFLEDETEFSETQHTYLLSYIRKNLSDVLLSCVDLHNVPAMKNALNMCSDRGKKAVEEYVIDEAIKRTSPEDIELKSLLIDFKSKTWLSDGVVDAVDRLIKNQEKEVKNKQTLSYLKKIWTYGGNSITNYKGNETKVVVPASIGKDPIKILNGTFVKNEIIESVEIPEGVTEINYAFNKCLKLREIIIPESVNVIDGFSFENTLWEKGQGDFTIVNQILVHYNGKSEDVIVPEGVKYISCHAFDSYDGCTARYGKIYFPDSLLSIPQGAFYQVHVKEFHFKGKIVDIHMTNFYNMNGLTVFGPKGSSAEERARECKIPFVVEETEGEKSEDTSFVIDNHVLIKYIKVPGVTEISVPEEVTEIGEHAFWMCEELKSIKFHGGIHKIGRCAFYGCKGLQKIELYQGLTEIGAQAFDKCNSLKSIELPNGLETIEYYAFNNCSSLNAVKIPDGVISIGSNAFAGCCAVRSVKLPDSIREIDESSFDFCCDDFNGCKDGGGITRIENVVALMLAGCKIKDVLLKESDEWLKEHFDVAAAVYLTQAGKKVKERCEKILRSDMNKSTAAMIELVENENLQVNTCKKIVDFILPVYEMLDASQTSILRESLEKIGVKAALKMLPV